MMRDRELDRDPEWIALQERVTKSTSLELDILMLAEAHGVPMSEVVFRASHLDKYQKLQTERRENGFFPECNDCGYIVKKNHFGDMHEYYNVHDDVWAASGLGPKDGMLCIGCLESRIGRKLHKDDFGNCQINTHPGYSRSDRFMDRLTRSADGEQSEVAVS